ncbi:uncharacterized protein LOC127872082 [Dreissena polymorpha]|uniref:uncharacterized protein LOC127872082 n=1 Tax=Dreissena polymorpha TaxID=45954 RepID=UPI002264618E|nr:uncharacterized protein LOC127872082 [Dreissena polymorpha]
MPLSIKQISRQVATPSPTQTGDVLNKLLATKDIINRTLLSQHKRASYLANVLIEVEENIRETTEIAVKNIKNDIEKSKRKITPGIKRLQDSLKGLSKSETFIKHDDKGGKNADTKKAKRRIKEAQKLMQDFPSGNVEYSVSTCLADHITQLCNRLMQLSIKITSSKFDYNETPRNYQSDSDSDERTQRMNERSNSANNIYDEIGHYLEDDPYLRPTRKTEIKDQERRPEVPPLLLSHLEPSELSKLNSVHLFSSDSDSDDDFDTGKFMPFNLQPRNRSPLVRQPRIGEIKQHKETRYVREGVRRSRSPKSPKPDNGVREHNSPKQDKPVDNIHGTKFTSKVNRMSGGNHGSLQKPIDNYVETMSSTLDRTKSETRALTFESYSKPTPKRLLPAIPKPADDVTDGVTILPRVICTNTNQDAVVSEEQSNMKTEQHIPVNTNIMPYVDIEEIEFRKTIRTARKEILDKLKRKNRGTPVNETSVSEELKMSDLVSNHSTQNTSQISNFALTLPYSKPTQVTGVPIMSRTISSVSRMNDNGIFKSKLVQVGSSVNNPNDSIVSSNIKKFEATIWNNELVELNNSKLKHSTPPRKNGPHLRSSSEPRSTLSVIKSSAKFLRRPSPLKNNALRPRHDSSGSSTFNDSEKDKTEDSAIGSSSNGSSFLLKSCTENDLNDLEKAQTTSNDHHHHGNENALKTNNKESNTLLKSPLSHYEDAENDVGKRHVNSKKV